MESLQVRKMINKPNPFGLGMLQGCTAVIRLSTQLHALDRTHGIET
jgi:hypothetical protein